MAIYGAIAVHGYDRTEWVEARYLKSHFPNIYVASFFSERLGTIPSNATRFFDQEGGRTFVLENLAFPYDAEVMFAEGIFRSTKPVEVQVRNLNMSEIFFYHILFYNETGTAYRSSTISTSLTQSASEGSTR